jgi:hypothetical protein
VDNTQSGQVVVTATPTPPRIRPREVAGLFGAALWAYACFFGAATRSEQHILYPAGEQLTMAQAATEAGVETGGAALIGVSVAGVFYGISALRRRS